MYVLSATGVNLATTTLDRNPVEVAWLEVSVAVAAPKAMIWTRAEADFHEEVFEGVEAELNTSTACAVITMIVRVVANGLRVLECAILCCMPLDASVTVAKCD